MGVGSFNCSKCEGYGWLPEPDRAWWQFWKSVECPRCGGDGDAKPPGWPDKAEMERLTPDPPPLPPPPPRQQHAPLLVVNPQLSMAWCSEDDSVNEETRELVRRLCCEARKNLGENRHALTWITVIEDRLCEHLDGATAHREPAA